MTFMYIEPEAASFVAPTPHRKDFRDDFESSGNMNGRLGWMIQSRSTTPGESNSMSASSGAFGGTTGTGTYALHQVDDPLTARVNRVLGNDLPKDTGTPNAINSHLSLDTGTPSSFIFNLTRQTSGTLLTGQVTMQQRKNTNIGTNITPTINNLRYEHFDVWSEVWNSGVVSLYMNGRACNPPVDVTAHVGPIGTGVPLNGRFGAIGNIGASTYLDFWASSGDQAWIMGEAPHRTVQINDDGGGNWRIPITYNGIIGRVDWALFDASDNSVAVAWAQVETTGDVINVSTNDAETPATFYYMLRRHLGNGNYVYWRGPLQRLGPVIAGMGQSLESDVDRHTTSGTVTVPANCFRIDAQRDVIADSRSRRQLAIGSNVVPAHFAKAYNDISGLPFTLVAGGESSTSTTDRLPGTAIYNALVDGIAHAGWLISLFFDTSGPNDLANAALYKINMVATFEPLVAMSGGTARVAINPMNKSWTNTDAQCQALRRAQWELCQERPDLFVYGVHVLDVRNLNSLHLGTSTTDTLGSNAEFARRRGLLAALLLGDTALDYRGPQLVGFTKLDAQTLRWQFQVGDFDSIALPNTASGNYHGGTRVSTSSALTSPIWPTGATVDASPSGGLQNITMTYPSGSFPGAAYGGFGWGANPANPLQDSATNNTDWATKASYVVGVKSGMPNIGARPYHGATVDYLMAA